MIHPIATLVNLYTSRSTNVDLMWGGPLLRRYSLGCRGEKRQRLGKGQQLQRQQQQRQAADGGIDKNSSIADSTGVTESIATMTLHKGRNTDHHAHRCSIRRGRSSLSPERPPVDDPHRIPSVPPFGGPTAWLPPALHLGLTSAAFSNPATGSPHPKSSHPPPVSSYVSGLQYDHSFALLRNRVFPIAVACLIQLELPTTVGPLLDDLSSTSRSTRITKTRTAMDPLSRAEATTVFVDVSNVALQVPCTQPLRWKPLSLAAWQLAPVLHHQQTTPPGVSNGIRTPRSDTCVILVHEHVIRGTADFFGVFTSLPLIVAFSALHEPENRAELTSIQTYGSRSPDHRVSGGRCTVTLLPCARGINSADLRLLSAAAQSILLESASHSTGHAIVSADHTLVRHFHAIVIMRS